MSNFDTVTDREARRLGAVGRLGQLLPPASGGKAPAGFESNFMKTVGEDGWFVYFRLYAPLQPFFDKAFRLPDFEPIG